MNGRRAIPWRRWLFPPTGHRLIDRQRDWRDWHIPLVNWGYYGLTAWFTPRLVLLGAVGVVLPLGAFVVGLANEIALLGFALTGLITAGLGAGRLMCPHLRVTCTLPERVERGKRFPVRYAVHNAGRRSACDVTLDSLPYPSPADLWLRSAQVAFLEAGGRCDVEGSGVGRRRGRYRLHPFRWDTDFPLGLWRCGRTRWNARALTVYPAYTPLHKLDIPLGARFRLDTHAARQLSRAALEFHGCREFRAGDAVRHLHPRSSARAGTPVVKEFQAEGRGRTAVIVDTWARLPAVLMRAVPDPWVEACLSLGAAVVDALARDDRVLELLVAGPGLYRFESAGRAGYREHVLDILASVDPVRRDPLPDLQPVAIEEIRAIQSVCLILGRWNAQRAELVRELEAWQVGVKVILVGATDGEPPPDLPAQAVRVGWRAVQRGEVNVL